jgi:hypothetical protein
VFRGGQGASGAGGQQLVTGRVLSVNDGSITVEVRQPGQQGASPSVTSEIVLVGASTRIVRTTESDIKASDLKANDQIQIVGTTDASGNVAASAIIVGGNALQQLLGGQGAARARHRARRGDQALSRATSAGAGAPVQPSEARRAARSESRSRAPTKDRA